VIGKKAKGIKASEAEDYILGYTILNDVTARDIQKSDGQWTRGKTMDLFAPVGPWIVTDLDPSDLELTTRLNGQVKQHTRTSLLMWSVPRILEFITQGITLLPGDVVATGTPAGIGPMQVGDVVEIEIENIGVLRNHVVQG
jgi:2-keto-4-pentenoate hydratase/2-oxohepta-3-ene-1,7-dioic acid hydratase in catechol pathway